MSAWNISWQHKNNLKNTPERKEKAPTLPTNWPLILLMGKYNVKQVA